MKLSAKWQSVLLRRKFQAAPGGDEQLEEATASGLDNLQMRLNHWTDLWTQETDQASRTAAQQVVAERLSTWMERCFGQHVKGSLSGNESQISLASSTPIFTAFLGRRATRELSRRVLQDI